jgi:hypothetical protein
MRDVQQANNARIEPADFMPAPAADSMTLMRQHGRDRATLRGPPQFSLSPVERDGDGLPGAERVNQRIERLRSRVFRTMVQVM